MSESICTVDPLGTGNHSDDLVEVYHGCATPALVCGYHATYWPELVHTAAHKTSSPLDNGGGEAETSMDRPLQ